MAKKRKKARSDRPSKLDETLAQLEQIKRDSSQLEVRLLADDVRDGLVEISKKAQDRLRRLSADKRKYQKQSRGLRHRLVDLLHDLATGPLLLPRAADRPAVE